MSIILCHECDDKKEDGSEEQFYLLNAVLRDPENKRLAYSGLQVNICQTHFKKVLKNMHHIPEQMSSNWGIAVEERAESFHKFVRSEISEYYLYLPLRFIDELVAREKLSNSTNDLFRNPKWIEYYNPTDWRPALWADALFSQYIE